MARFEGILPTEVINMFETLELNTEKMLGDMVEAGAEVARQNVEAKMPRQLRAGLLSSGDSIRITRVYKTPSDDGINCQVMIDGYFINRDGIKTPAPLVANLFEYGRSSSPYPKQPFFRQSFNKSQIEKAMLKVQEKYIKGD
jgi:hypothetical protein